MPQKIKMLTTAANAKHVLHAGKTYLLDDETAKPLLAGPIFHAVPAEKSAPAGLPQTAENAEPDAPVRAGK